MYLVLPIGAKLGCERVGGRVTSTEDKEFPNVKRKFLIIIYIKLTSSS